MPLHTESCTNVTHRLTPVESEKLSTALQHWQIDNDTLSKTFTFSDYYRTMAFVNACAWIAHQQNHHPTLKVEYNQCQVHYTTHSIKGLSRNDFICAARIDQIATDE